MAFVPPSWELRKRELLEMFAVQAAIAIDNARLTEALHAEQRRLASSERAFRVAFESAKRGRIASHACCGEPEAAHPPAGRRSLHA